MNLRIGIDIDGVIADFTNPHKKKLEQISGHKPDWDEKTDPNCWSWEEVYGYSKEHTRQFWDHTASVQGWEFWRELPTLCTMEEREIISGLCTDNDVFFISSRPIVHRKTTDRWLHRQFGESTEFTTILTRFKGHIAAGLELHAMIDDKPENLVDVLRYRGRACKPFLLNRPWNQVDVSSSIIRVNSITEALDLLERGVYNGNRRY